MTTNTSHQEGDPRAFAGCLRAAIEELARSPLARTVAPTGNSELLSLRLMEECYRALTEEGIDGVSVVDAMLHSAGAVYGFLDVHASDSQFWENFR